jgi:hypothetical protein
LQLHANAGSPLLNPAFVIENWGEAIPALAVDGKPVAWGSDARFGLVPSLEGTTLVVWLRMESENETSIELKPQLTQSK